jgi:hypothetical protein
MIEVKRLYHVMDRLRWKQNQEFRWKQETLEDDDIEDEQFQTRSTLLMRRNHEVRRI